MRYRTGAQIVFCYVDILERNQIEMFVAEIQMLCRRRRIRNMNVARRMKNAHAKHDVLNRIIIAVTPLALCRNFAFHVMVLVREQKQLNINYYLTTV